MAKKAKNLPKPTPILTAALFCERTFEDLDGVVSVIRIVDTMNITLDTKLPENIPSEEDRVPISIQGLISLKSFGSASEHEMELVMESPNGRKMPVTRKSFKFKESAVSGFNLRLSAQILIAREGLYWMHVLVDGKRLTKMPFLINITRRPLSDATKPVSEKLKKFEKPRLKTK